MRPTAIKCHMTAQLWWRNPDGSPHAYLAEDGQWFYTTTGEQVGYRDGRSIYSPTGALIGTVDNDDKWIAAPSGESLGYLVP
jgi:hypothetical protein